MKIDNFWLQNGYNFVKLKKNLRELIYKCLFLLVAKGGIEPPTQGFSVLIKCRLLMLIVIQIIIKFNRNNIVIKFTYLFVLIIIPLF